MSVSTNVTNEYSVEVNFTGDNLDPERVTSLLGLEPKKAARAGDQRRKDRETAVYEEGFWSYEISSNDDIHECRDHQINCLVDTISPQIEELRQAGVERIYFYYTLSSFYGMMNVRLKSGTMEKLANIGADLYLSGFDCFNPNHPFWKDGEAERVEADGEESTEN